jgi:magnesium transporter
MAHDNRSESEMATSIQPLLPLTALIVDSDGVQRIAVAADLRRRIAAGKFLWIDLVGGDEAARLEFLNELALESEDIAWVQRFGQTGRMTLRRRGLRAVTWLADATGTLMEVHVLGSPRWILTLWNGDVAALELARLRFAEGEYELEKSPYLGAAILLQFLLATLDEAITGMDARLYEMEEQMEIDPQSLALAELRKRLSRRQSTWARFERYSNSVQLAIVGVEAVPGIDARAAAELNDYADQVEDVERRFHERIEWGSDALHNHTAALARRQGQQINRLTVVASIFLPLTFITGFFGMNFHWMVKGVGSAAAFVVLGIVFPVMSAALSIVWLKRRRLL